jgi:hypothetical protein
MATRKRKKTRPGVVPVIDQENPKTTKKPAQNRGRGRESSNGSSWSVLVEHRPEWIRESGHRYYTSACHRCYLVQTSSSSISSLESWRQFLPPRDSCVRSCRGQEIENRATVIGAKEVEYQMLFFVMSGVRSRSTECGLAVRVNRRFTWNCYLSTAASCIQQIESSSDGDERSKVKMLSEDIESGLERGQGARQEGDDPSGSDNGNKIKSTRSRQPLIRPFAAPRTDECVSVPPAAAGRPRRRRSTNPPTTPYDRSIRTRVEC